MSQDSDVYIKTVHMVLCDFIAFSSLFYVLKQMEHEKYEKICEEAFQHGKNIKDIKFAEWLDSPWIGR